MKLEDIERINSTRRQQTSISFVEVVIIFIILLVISMVFVQPYFEMQAFNNHTNGKKATYFEAMFADLRIISEN